MVDFRVCWELSYIFTPTTGIPPYSYSWKWNVYQDFISLVGSEFLYISYPKRLISLFIYLLLPLKKQRHYFANKGPSSQGYGLSIGHVWMRELDYKESWMQKNWCFWTVVLQKTLESPLDYKEIQPVPPKGDQSWVFIGRTDVEAETPILWPPDAKTWLIGKYPDAGKDWGQEEKGTTEDEMVGWHQQLDGHEFE